ncbi:hypothetical protein Patl1_04446 [Pistacia atlantica]|uniref:Uncharacterized protein n=1 Tax=Pistacia atlantica TaxID=434234 RepID=A0ACC1BT19_9ROSI|nr:hypothetical protein Patl1_04446 [Pistacia atlantica]
MSLSIVSAAAASVENIAKEETNRRSANYHASIWGDHFLSYASDSMETDHTARLLELKEEIRKLIIADTKKPAEKLDLIDAIQSHTSQVHGENILDEALAFTTTHLESIAAQLSPPVAAQVKHALNRPIRKGLQRIDARHYMSIFQEDTSQSHNEVLLAFAKLDFNILQKMHQIELSHIAKWDVSAMDQLPGYMKLCYQALLDVYSETEKDMADQGRLYLLHFAKEAMKTLVRNYFYEAKWCHKNYVPSLDEYMTVALVNSAYSMLATTSFVGMGNIVTKEAFEWLFTNPKMIKASSVIGRLMNDMVSDKVFSYHTVRTKERPCCLKH